MTDLDRNELRKLLTYGDPDDYYGMSAQTAFEIVCAWLDGDTVTAHEERDRITREQFERENNKRSAEAERERAFRERMVLLAAEPKPMEEFAAKLRQPVGDLEAWLRERLG